MSSVVEKIQAIGLIPVIKISDVSKAVPLAKALCKGGIPAAEVTFRTEQAAEPIRLIKKEVPDMLLGAGTVLTPAQADAAIEAGASFIVSPGLNPEVVKHCIAKGVPMMPGCANPSDVELAMSLGLDVVKFFPAEQAGGVKMIKAMSAPYGNLKFMPTGGVNESNLNDYLSFKKIIACGGSWMVKADLIENGDFDQITALCRSAVNKMLGIELAHIGINTADEADASAVAGKIASTLPIDEKVGNSSIFVGKIFEVMKGTGAGANGHIALAVNDIDRAVNYFSYMGIAFDEDSAKKKDGKLVAIYFKEQLGGFAIHLVQKS